TMVHCVVDVEFTSAATPPIVAPAEALAGRLVPVTRTAVPGAICGALEKALTTDVITGLALVEPSPENTATKASPSTSVCNCESSPPNLDCAAPVVVVRFVDVVERTV